MKLDRQAISIAPRAKVAQEVVLVLEDGTVFRGRGLRLFGQTLSAALARRYARAVRSRAIVTP
jgi:hypothetical protein